MGLEIVKYNDEEHFELWDDFVSNQSENGTIFYSRKFLSYHPKGHFSDQSLLIYDNGKLVALFLAAEIDGEIHSHPGTSAGGAVFSSKYFSSSKVRNVLQEIEEYFSQKVKFQKISESVFYEGNNNSAMLYFLQSDYIMYAEYSHYFDLQGQEDVIANVTRSKMRTRIRKELKSGFKWVIADNDDQYEFFHAILNKNLEKHDASSLHSIEDFLSLKQILGDKQKLCVVLDESNEIIAGTWLIEARSGVWHTQYIAQNYDKTNEATLATLLLQVAEYGIEENVKYMNLGISTENRGAIYNAGLASFKESLGTKPVLRYILERK